MAVNTNADNEWGCGACSTPSLDCFDCTPSAAEVDTGCNKLETETFLCHDYMVDGDKLVQKETPVNCPKEKGVHGMCNYPGEMAGVDYVVANNGCGPCPNDLEDGMCRVCDEEKCGAQAMALSLICLLYTSPSPRD